VAVAHEIAAGLECPLEVLIVRKLGYPGHEEAAFGAVGEEGVLAPELLAGLGPEDRGHAILQAALEAKRPEVEAQIALYRGGRARRSAAGCTAIVADDGVATGYTFAAALEIVRRDGPRRLVAAIPVAAFEGAALVSRHCDEARLLEPAHRGRFFAVSMHYESFDQVTDEQVLELLGGEAAGT
jgi:putative phosphoribosyl transferase